MALEDIDPDIVGMLLPGEQVIFIASQSKVAPGGSLSPNSINITNMRVLFKDSRSGSGPTFWTLATRTYPRSC